jgi:Nucleotide-sugar transporter
MLSNLFSVKYAALALLVLQNTFLVVFMRYSRTSEGPMYASSTAVAVMEVVKFVTCMIVILYQKKSIQETVKCVYEVILISTLLTTPHMQIVCLSSRRNSDILEILLI